MRLQEVGQEPLGKVLGGLPRLLLAGQADHVRAGGIHNLAGIGGEPPLTTRFEVGRLHDLPGGLLDRHRALRPPFTGLGQRLPPTLAADLRFELRPGFGHFQHERPQGLADLGRQRYRRFASVGGIEPGQVTWTNRVTGSSPSISAVSQSSCSSGKGSLTRA